MTRSRMFLLTGALLLGFFLVGSVLAVRMTAPAVIITADQTLVAGSPSLAVGSPTLEVSAPGLARETTPMTPGSTRTLALGAADKLKVTGAWKVVLVPGPEGQARVTAPENSSLKMRVRNDGGTLSVESSGNSQGQPLLEVSLPRLKTVDASGAAFVDLATLKADRFILEASGATTLVGAGTVKVLELHSSGAARVDLGKVSASEAWIDASGAANLVIRCDGTVDGEASGAASVLVTGAATVRVDTSGAAHVNTDR